jgi:hypothetical protein
MTRRPNPAPSGPGIVPATEARLAPSLARGSRSLPRRADTPGIRQPGVRRSRANTEPTRSRFGLWAYLKAGGRGNPWRGSSVDGADDLAAVDALQVDAGDPEVGVPELALDHDERNAFVRHLDRVGVPQLVRRDRRLTPAAAAAWRNRLRAADGSQRRPAVGPWITHNTVPIGSSRRISSHGSSCSHAQRSIPTSRRLPPFPRRTSTAPRERSRSLSWSEGASLIRSPARQSSTISARSRWPSARSLIVRMTATISSTVGGSAGYCSPLLRGGRPRW